MLPQWLSSKEFTCNAGAAGEVGLILGLGGSSEVGHGSPLQYSCLENIRQRSLAGYIQSIAFQSRTVLVS